MTDQVSQPHKTSAKLQYVVLCMVSKLCLGMLVSIWFWCTRKTCQSPRPGVTCQSKLWFGLVRYFFCGFEDHDIS